MIASKSQGTFLFTSESVGEGHPDKIAYVSSEQFTRPSPAGFPPSPPVI